MPPGADAGLAITDEMIYAVIAPVLAALVTFWATRYRNRTTRQITQYDDSQSRIGLYIYVLHIVYSSV